MISTSRSTAQPGCAERRAKSETGSMISASRSCPTRARERREHACPAASRGGGRNRMQAFTLIELLIVLAVLGAVSIWQLQRQLQQLDLRRAAVAAAHFARYNDAVARYVQDQGVGAQTRTYLDSAWLKGSADCPGVGQASQAWLPCSFPDRMPFGLRYRTSIANTAGEVSTETRTLPAQLLVRGRLRADLAATVVAEATVRSEQAVHFALSARNEITARYNSRAGADRFLRVDGGNHMQANLDMHGNSLVAARNLAFGDSLLRSSGTTDSIELGGRGGAGFQRGGQHGNILHPGSGQPHIDFHHANNRQEDFNVRISNSADGALRVQNSAGAEVSLLDLPGQVVQGLSIVSNGTQVPKPQCGAGLSPQVFLMPVSFIGTPDGARRRTIAGLRSWAADLGPGAWRVNFEVLPEGRNWTTSSARLLALTKCTL